MVKTTFVGGGYDTIDVSYASLKILAGHFFEENEKVYLIAGTEVSQNLYGGENCSIFIYNVTDDKVVLCELLDNAVSMTAICEAGNFIYFATISSSRLAGCDLYRYSKSNKSIEKAAHFEQRGVYALAFDGDRNIIAVTSDNIALYLYNMETQSVALVRDSFSQERYARSLSYCDGYVYIGIGTHADLIKLNLESGESCSVLSEQYKSNAFIYSQGVMDDKIYMLVSPSYEILEYNLSDGIIRDSGFRYSDEIIEYKALASCSNNRQQVPLLGKLLYIGCEGVAEIENFGTLVSFVGENADYGLDATGLVHIWNRDSRTEQLVDLYNYIGGDSVIPSVYFINNNKIYIPERRFCRYNLQGKRETVFLVKDEPQAVFYDENGIYTANYTKCTVYYYSWEIFDRQQYSVDMNSPEFLLADIENQCRPADLQVTEDKKYLLIASGALYGQFGGAVSMYDLETHSLIYTDIGIVQNQKIADIGLSSFKNCVWLGTSVYGEHTAPAYMDASPHLLLWNYVERKIVKDIVMEKKDLAIASIAESRGFVYCRTHSGKLRAYNINTCKKEFSDGKGWRGIYMLHNNSIISLTESEIIFIESPSNMKVLADGFENLHQLNQDMVTGRIYVFEGSQMFDISDVFSILDSE